MKGGARADSVPAKSAERRDWMDAACDPVIQQYLGATSGTSSCTTSSPSIPAPMNTLPDARVPHQWTPCQMHALSSSGLSLDNSYPCTSIFHHKSPNDFVLPLSARWETLGNFHGNLPHIMELVYYIIPWYTIFLLYPFCNSSFKEIANEKVLEMSKHWARFVRMSASITIK